MNKKKKKTAFRRGVEIEITDEMQKRFEDRLESESRAARPLDLDDLVCKDCVFRIPDANLSKCQKYEWKPSTVFTKGECKVYVRDEKRK